MKLLAASLVAAFAFAVPAFAGAQGPPSSTGPQLQRVVIVTRHGVRSPTNPDELKAYVARPWPAWEVGPGELTPHGAQLMTLFGRAYRARYAAAGLVSAQGCPSSQTVFAWADIDQRTRATARALLDGFAPGCDLVALDAGASTDPLFHPVPALGVADSARASAALLGATGGHPEALVAAYRDRFARLDDVLGCAAAGAGCRAVASEPAAAAVSSKTGLAGLSGPVALASTAAEDLLLAYCDGKPMSDFGYGTLDSAAILALSPLHALKSDVTTRTRYAARVQGSNLLAHVREAVDETPGRIPAAARLVAFVGHDTNLEALSGMLGLHWLVPDYQPDDTPPGGALVFETYRDADATFVRTFFTAQTPDEMRTLSTNVPAMAPVYVPGCPSLDCPLAAFDAAVATAVDPKFVGTW